MRRDFLSESSILALRGLLGLTIHTIFAPNLDAAGAHLAAWKLSLLLKKDLFVNFSCKWSETPLYLNDSWLIEVAPSTEPIGILRNASGALVEPCTISMYEAQPIRKIELFEYRYDLDEGTEESVHYDRAIVFRCAEERSFCISCMLNGPGTANYLHFSEDNGVIQEMIDESTIRLVVE
jgi:hypothetical protein